MSGSFRKRQSKWDHKDSDGLTENLHDKAQTRRPREPVSPRGSRRHDGRSKEKMMTWEQEGNDTRISTGVVESRQHNSRSPRNVWGRLHRSRSRSRSRSPSHYQRREPIGNDRSRNRSGVSAQICRNFAAGRCNRGSSCHFLHQDAQPYDNRQPLDCSPREDWESRQRGVGGSRYSPVDTNDYAPRSEKSNRICSEFLKGRCRRGASCRYEHPDLVDEFKDNLIDDVHRDRDRDRDRDRSGPRRSRNTYSQRNHGREPVDDDVHQDRDRVGLHRSRDAFSHRSHDREPLDDDIHQDRDRANRSRDTYSHRKYDREPSDVFEKGPIDDVHRDRDNFHRNRDTYSHQNHDREHADLFENRPVDDGHRDRDNALNSRDTYTHRNHDSEPADMYEKRPVEDDLRDRDDPRRSRDTHQIHDHKLADVYEKGPVDDAYRDRDNDHKARNTYRSRDREPHKRGGTLCKFFASGNCANGNRCRFIHEVRETLSPGRRCQDDKWGSDHKVESNWDGPTWKDATAMRNMPPVRGWGEDENKAIDEPPANSRMTPVDNDRIQIKDEKPPLPWETENSAPITSLSASRGVENVSRDMEMSPRDVLQHPLNSSNSHPASLSDISFPTVQPNLVGEACYEKPYPVGFQEPPKVHNEPFAPQIPSHREEKPVVYHGEGRNIIPTTNIPPQQGFFQTDQIIAPQPTHFPSQTMNVQSQHGVFQTDLNVAVQPSSGPSAPTLHFQIPSMNVSSQQSFFPTEQNLGAQSSSAPSLPSLPSLPVPQGQAPFPSEISEGNRVLPSHNPSSFLNSDGSQVVDATQSGLVVATAASLSTVSDEQLAQLSTLSASLAQLLENRHQLPQLGSSGFPSEPTTQMNQIPETSKQYDPISDSAEPNLHNMSENQVVDDEDVNMKQQEPVIVSTDYEKVKKTADRSINVPENRPSEDEGDDGNKSKDTKAIRPFKFALAEFVKELLKPFWKDGQVSKDAYKAIVKKVVDKVIETQGLQIPQTKEKIDVYLSCSKPKIEKLVQAYVGKFQKN